MGAHQFFSKICILVQAHHNFKKLAFLVQKRYRIPFYGNCRLLSWLYSPNRILGSLFCTNFSRKCGFWCRCTKNKQNLLFWCWLPLRPPGWHPSIKTRGCRRATSSADDSHGSPLSMGACGPANTHLGRMLSIWQAAEAKDHHR